MKWVVCVVCGVAWANLRYGVWGGIVLLMGRNGDSGGVL